MENENIKPSMKQWIPLYGIYKVLKDNMQGKPSFAGEYGTNHPEIRVTCFISSISRVFYSKYNYWHSERFRSAYQIT